MKNGKLMLIICVSLATLMLSGCIGKDGISIPLGDGESVTIGVGENGDGVTIGSGNDGESITIGTEEDGITFETQNEDGESGSLSIGSSTTKLPERFPSEIPFPSEYQIYSSMELSDGDTDSISITYFTESVTVDELFDMFLNFTDAHGYEKNSELRMEGMNSLVISNSDSTISFNIFSDESSPITVGITIAHTN
ncbi:hypothetical protein [Evansella tamaricis]|uniref:Lipoprotein n=1 Tax=Evansella tamaricis TaxID=2069301 RepID=A0ABS6JJ12_9BACI|nr:hypothetical protein [Evansella tamaricis]MBU9713674.1 hypothetical protein [Evansella tamaricis]